MGIVYEAEQASPRRTVALKVIRPGIASARMLRRFEHEAELLGTRDQPGIAQIFEAGTAESDFGLHPYFAMGLVRGEPITRYARNRKLGTRASLELLAKVCDAVEHAHQHGIIHRDLKPGNILVVDETQERQNAETPKTGTGAHQPSYAGNGRDDHLLTSHSSLLTSSALTKVPDFGVARAIDSDMQTTTLQTDIGQLIGTVPYMSPEQVTGDPAAIDTRSDVYSLGVLCYELLAERLPYDLAAKTIPEAVRIIRDNEPTPLSAVNRVFRGDLETIVTKTLEKDRRLRYQSATQLAADLRRYLNNEPILARPPSAAYQLRKLISRHKVPFTLVGLLFVVSVAFAVVATTQAIRATEQRKRETEARTSAEAFATFLERLFESADPGAREDADPSVRDLLETGVVRLETDLQEQPLVRARLATVIGSVFGNLGDFPRATELLESAVSIRRQELGGNHPDLGVSLERLAGIYGLLGDHDRAHALRLEVLDICRHHFGEPHEDVADAYDNLGNSRYYAGDQAEAVRYFRQAVETRRGLHGDDDLGMAASLHNLGSALQALGRNDEAVEALQSALETKRALLGDDVAVILTLNQLGFLEFGRGALEAAERFFAEAAEMSRRVHHDTHPKLAWSLNNYAYVVNAMRGPADAEPIYREALAIRRAAFGKEHPDIALSLADLANMRLFQEDYENAALLHSQALEMRRSLFGNDHDVVTHSLAALAECHLGAGRPQDAEPLLLEGHDILARIHGEESPECLAAAQKLGTLYQAWHDAEPGRGHDAKAAEWQGKLGAATSQSTTRAGE
ncbi:MAG: serine/threonine protein kinase [bacterium]|nr:serine/threonine protein kinase [bacterium]